MAVYLKLVYLTSCYLSLNLRTNNFPSKICPLRKRLLAIIGLLNRALFPSEIRSDLENSEQRNSWCLHLDLYLQHYQLVIRRGWQAWIAIATDNTMM